MKQLIITQSITARDSESLDRYLSEISKCELISAEEEVILAEKIHSGDQIALDKLVNANLRFVVSVAKQYQNYGMNLTDLINEGNIGLIKAAKRFDEKRGFKFISYAVWWIRQSIIQSIGEHSRVVRLPLNKISTINKIKKESAILEQKLEREASIEELADELQITNMELALTLSVSNKHISTDALLGESDSLSFMDVFIDTEASQPDDQLMVTSLQLEIKRMLSILSVREKDVIRLFYGIDLNHPFTLKEIGDKYHLTKERVRQIKEKAIRSLKKSSRNKLLIAYLGNH